MSKKPKLVYYEFECGCQIPAKNKKWPRKKTCPKHGAALKSKCLECLHCGKHLPVPSGSNIKYCDECREKVKDGERKEYQQKNRERINETRRKLTAEKLKLNPKPVKKPVVKKLKLKPVKKIFNQTPRGECKWGDYCMAQQFKTGIEFNCHGCLRFRKLKLNPMDYVKAVSPWDTAEMFNGQLRKTRINKS